MKTTFKKILEAKEGLQTVMKKSLPVKQAVSLAKLIRKIDSELEVFEEQRRKLFSEFSTDKEKIDADKIQQFTEKYTELLNLETELESEKVTVSVDEIDTATVITTDDFLEFDIKENES